MGRDDWKYDEDSLQEGEEEEEKAAPPKERQCAKCLHWVDPDVVYCPWCGKAQEEMWKR